MEFYIKSCKIANEGHYMIRTTFKILQKTPPASRLGGPSVTRCAYLVETDPWVGGEDRTGKITEVTGLIPNDIGTCTNSALSVSNDFVVLRSIKRKKEHGEGDWSTIEEEVV
ncbi:hypothetical protein GWI33_003567 [Rhynchophorus ferrugineus]|uniref:Uncharacterized protein n=1 Tax=Rhynchophorus ferrugineus TaxID=354439 RepID=A0A834LX12_RHYFE|nr:hypothetical protein GWI33_003569 [Rhynchophorus ferrugineus]KAF7263143.1 hypothetical protein GWI33_003567 [Rhynchophorus ferrugineus]